MLKLTKVAEKSWWVPESSPTALAVQIKTAAEYPQAIRDKVERLIEKAGSEAADLVRSRLEQDGGRLEDSDPEMLARALLRMQDIGEIVRMGNPEMAQPASQEDALDAIEAQADLTLEDFLG